MNRNTIIDLLFFGGMVLVIVMAHWMLYALGEPRTVWLINMLSEWF